MFYRPRPDRKIIYRGFVIEEYDFGFWAYRRGFRKKYLTHFWRRSGYREKQKFYSLNEAKMTIDHILNKKNDL